ncbi:unnamed protein product, partial [Laminaria digitata]
RSARSELACLHLRTRMCGARVLSGVLQKWTSRQSARAFWRLRAATHSSQGPTPSCARCDSAADDHAIGDSNGSPRRCSDDVGFLTIQAPTRTDQDRDDDVGGGGGGCASWGSPLGSDGGSWDKRSHAARGEGGPDCSSPSTTSRRWWRRERQQHQQQQCDYHGLRSTATTVTAGTLTSPDGSGGGASVDAFEGDAP